MTIESPISGISSVFDGPGLHTPHLNSDFVISIGTRLPILKSCVFNPDPVTDIFFNLDPGLFDYCLLHF